MSPRLAALAAFDRIAVRPVPFVSYASRGRLLVLGSSTQVATVVDLLPASLSATLAIRDAASAALKEALRRRGLPVLEQAVPVALQGWLGDFRVHLDGGSAGTAVFDLVLDLGAPPVVDLPVPPIGYFAPRGDARRLTEALDELTDLVGQFDKPKFFTYRPDVCAHHSGAVRGCQACIEVCGAAAIQSGQGTIEVIPHLCQGCGDCSTACPSGAIGYAFPPLGDTLNRLRAMLGAWQSTGAQAPVLLLHAGERSRAVLGQPPNWLLPYELEALGAAGMEVWLSALAYGATAVWLLDAGDLSPLSLANLQRQLGYANQLLEAMGCPAGRLRLVTVDALPQLPAPGPFLSRMAGHAGLDDKRTALRLALDHLHRHAPRQPEAAALSAGAPFGQIAVDADRCTLCLACVSSCPEGALQDGRDLPQLKFIEANCVQCGRCASACPEQAITLAPRYLFDSSQSRQPHLLHEADVFRCVECGKPFATAAMIKTITERLRHHPMFQGDAARRLTMCEDCRVNAHFRSL